jgi:hypothetical protein
VSLKNKYFEDFNSYNASDMSDPISEWLSTPTIPGADGLMYWNAMEASRHPLSQMGLNFLSAPGNFIYISLVLSRINLKFYQLLLQMLKELSPVADSRYPR